MLSTLKFKKNISMPLKHFIEDSPAVIGSYKPSENWDKYTHFAVMERETGSMIASVGYFQSLETIDEWTFENYKHAATCIEQGQLYANAPRLFQCLEALLSAPLDSLAQERARAVLREILDIEEPLKRLIGEDAPSIVEQADKISMQV